MGEHAGVPMPTEDRSANALQMIRADVRMHDLQRWMGSRRIEDPDHAMHNLLTECFGELAPKPFRLITPRGAAASVLYGYGAGGAAALRERAGVYADPLQARIIPPGGIDSKPLPATWEAGRRLGFEVRIRPVVRRSGRGGERPAGERDAFQLEADQYPPGGMPRDREAVYAEWLSQEFERRQGADVDPSSVQLISFRRTRSLYREGGQRSEGPDAIVRGILVITDGEAFARLLARGIGRHRAYGYGMLLLRPALR